jgi:hypothetical protein
MPDSRVLSPGNEVRALNAFFIYSFTASAAVVCTCHTYNPVTPSRPDAPVVTEFRTTEARLFGTWRETVRLRWTPPPLAEPVDIKSYTLIRKTANDSVFDVFIRSQEIPPVIDTFFDDIKPIGFPKDSFLLVQYRAFAVDRFGRSGDTSAACSLYLARQPEIDTIDPVRSVFRWRSQFIQGSVSTYLKLWNAEHTVLFSSPRQEQFGSWDYPSLFSAQLPDSLVPMPPGRWYCSIYLLAMGIGQSLKVDSIYVPD